MEPTRSVEDCPEFWKEHYGFWYDDDFMRHEVEDFKPNWSKWYVILLSDQEQVTDHYVEFGLVPKVYWDAYHRLPDCELPHALSKFYEIVEHIIVGTADSPYRNPLDALKHLQTQGFTVLNYGKWWHGGDVSTELVARGIHPMLLRPLTAIERAICTYRLASEEKPTFVPMLFDNSSLVDVLTDLKLLTAGQDFEQLVKNAIDRSEEKAATSSGEPIDTVTLLEQDPGTTPFERLASQYIELTGLDEHEGETNQLAVTDILTDLMLWADKRDVDFEQQLDVARRHFYHEQQDRKALEQDDDDPSENA